jgi:hypothetical protein
MQVSVCDRRGALTSIQLELVLIVDLERRVLLARAQHPLANHRIGDVARPTASMRLLVLLNPCGSIGERRHEARLTGQRRLA